MTIDLQNEFTEQDLTTAEVIPWIQIVNPPNVKNLKKITENDWGLWLSKENAEAIGFNPDGDPNWKFVDLENNWENSVGYLSHATRFMVVHQSEMEVQEKSASGKAWKFVDVAYKYGFMTEAMERCQESSEMRFVVRALLILLGKNNEPLHDGVVQFTMRGVLGASFGSQYREFKKEANKLFFAKLNKPEKRLADDVLNRFVFPFSMAIAPPKTSEASPSIYVSGRASLAVEANTAIEVYGRKVNLFAQSFESLYQGKDSLLGQKLATYRAEYSDFPLPRTQKLEQQVPDEFYGDPLTGEVYGVDQSTSDLGLDNPPGYATAQSRKADSSLEAVPF
jgi:hypothetical protein